MGNVTSIADNLRRELKDKPLDSSSKFLAIVTALGGAIYVVGPFITGNWWAVLCTLMTAWLCFTTTRAVVWLMQAARLSNSIPDRQPRTVTEAAADYSQVADAHRQCSISCEALRLNALACVACVILPLLLVPYVHAFFPKTTTAGAPPDPPATNWLMGANAVAMTLMAVLVPALYLMAMTAWATITRQLANVAARAGLGAWK